MTKKMRNFSLLLAILVFIVVSVGTIYSQEPPKDVVELARKSLQEYIRVFIDEKSAARFGFKNLDEVQRAQLGEPMKVMTIGLRDLKTYERGVGAKQVLKDATKYWFPVTVDGVARTKLDVVQVKGKWIQGEFGGVRPVLEVAAAKRKLSELVKERKVDTPRSVLLIEMPALLAVFIYADTDRGEFLVPATVQPQRYGLSNGELYVADEILIKLREYALKIEEDKLM